MSEYLIQGATLDAIADAINAKTGKSASMTPAEMVTEIESISGGATLQFFQSYEVITIATDMITTASGGNTQYFQNAYLPSVSEKPYPTVLILIENTFTGSYAACGAIRLSSLNENSPNSATTRLLLRSEGAAILGTNVAFYIGAGSKLHIYTFRGEAE